MVSFLLDNSLGAWWAARRLNDSDLKKASSEAELRTKAAIPCVPLSYLRFVRCDGDDTGGKTGWRLASGAFEGWPEHLGKLKILDPCCGSGHFLVAAFSMLVPMRMAQEGLAARRRRGCGAAGEPARTGTGPALRGACGVLTRPCCLDLARCTGGYRPLPELNLACSGLAPNATKEEWSALSEQAAAAGWAPDRSATCSVSMTTCSRYRFATAWKHSTISSRRRRCSAR